MSFAIYELLDQDPIKASSGSVGEEKAHYRTHFDEETKDVARKVESIIAPHTGVVDWQSNDEIKRLMRRDIKREIRPTDDYTEEQLDALAERIVALAIRRSSQ